MPELPEVDSYRTGLAKSMKGWKINSGKAIWHRASDADFEKLKGESYSFGQLGFRIRPSACLN